MIIGLDAHGNPEIRIAVDSDSAPGISISSKSGRLAVLTPTSLSFYDKGLSETASYTTRSMYVEENGQCAWVYPNEISVSMGTSVAEITKDGFMVKQESKAALLSPDSLTLSDSLGNKRCILEYIDNRPSLRLVDDNNQVIYKAP